MSLPGLYAKVRRARKIRVRAYDLEGNLVEHEADELLSRAIQHEADHLEGKLFIDYLDPLVKRSAGDKLRAFELDYRKAQGDGSIPADNDLMKRLVEMQRPAAEWM